VHRHGQKEASTASGRRILIVGADQSLAALKSTISQWSLDSVFCTGVKDAAALLPDATFSLIFCQDKLEDGTYQDVLRLLKKPSKTRFVVVSSELEVDEKYNEATEMGAFDMIVSPCNRRDVQWVIIRAMQEETGRHSSRRSPGVRNVEETKGDAESQTTHESPN